MSKLAEKFKKYTDPIKKIASQIWTAISEFAVEQFNRISAWWAENGASDHTGHEECLEFYFTYYHVCCEVYMGVRKGFS